MAEEAAAMVGEADQAEGEQRRQRSRRDGRTDTSDGLPNNKERTYDIAVSDHCHDKRSRLSALTAQRTG